MSNWPIAIEDITDLFAKEWKYDIAENKTKNSSKLERFYRTSTRKKITIQIFADSEEEYKRCMNDFEEITEKDIITETPGRLWCNEYYLNCFIETSAPKDYEECFYTIDNEITIVSFTPFWIKETEHNFKQSDIISTNNKRYPNRYGHRYANGMKNVGIINHCVSECNFKMIVYGPTVRPMVAVGEQQYYVDILLEEGEYLEVDSEKQTVEKVTRMGTKINAFHNRDFKNSVFKKIRTGYNEIVWSGKFDFDIIIREERSGPKW